MTNKASNPVGSVSPAVFAFLLAFSVALLWAYWTAFHSMAQRWWGDAQYSHGFLVPAFALGVLWWRRGQLSAAALIPNWWGLVLVAAGMGLRLIGAWYYLDWFDSLSLLPCLAGICVLLGGWPALRWSWPAIAFLFFMIPLPYSVETALAFPLRRLATVTSTYALQTVGFGALEEGTDIYVNEHWLQVAPACSGMGMLMIFFALSCAIALVSERPWIDKLVIVASAFPIAIVSNIVRIFLTAVLFELSTTQVAQAAFHKYAGWLMMVVGLALLWLELKLFDHLFIKVEPRSPAMSFGFKNPRASAPRPPAGGMRAPA
jgi:exosortase